MLTSQIKLFENCSAVKEFYKPWLPTMAPTVLLNPSKIGGSTSAADKSFLHPVIRRRPNGLAENFVKTLKRAISSFPSLDRAVDNFLLQYRNAVHLQYCTSPRRCRASQTSKKNLKKMEMPNKELCETDRIRIKYCLQPMNHPRLNQRTGPNNPKKIAES